MSDEQVNAADVLIGEFIARWDDAADGVMMDADTAQDLAREFKRMRNVEIQMQQAREAAHADKDRRIEIALKMLVARFPVAASMSIEGQTAIVNAMEDFAQALRLAPAPGQDGEELEKAFLAGWAARNTATLGLLYARDAWAEYSSQAPSPPAE